MSVTTRRTLSEANEALRMEVLWQKEQLKELQVEKELAHRLMADAIRIVFNSGAVLMPLFASELVGLAPTADGSAVQMFSGPITVTVAPFAQLISLIDSTGQVPVAVYMLSDGQLSKTDQIHMLGQIERIRRIAGGAEDPVSGTLSLSGLVNA